MQIDGDRLRRVIEQRGVVRDAASGSRRRCARPPDRRCAATGSPRRPSPGRTSPSARHRRQAGLAPSRTRAAGEWRPEQSRAHVAATRGAPAITRTTESSIRVAIARSCVSTKSAMPPSLDSASSSSMICGSSVRLPLVITIGRSMWRSSSRCSGVVGSMKPSVVRPGRNGFRQRVAGRAQQHDRCGGRGEQTRFLGRHGAVSSDDVQITRHQREWLGLAMLRVA